MSSFPLEELASLPSFYVPTLSYDRQYIAFYWDKTKRMELYVMPVGGTPRQVSAGQLARSLGGTFAWSRDSKFLYFPKDRDGDEQHNVWRLNVETGEAKQLTDNPKAQEYPVEVSPDDKTLLVMTNLRGQLNLFALDLATCQYIQLTDYKTPVWNGAQWSPDGKQIVYVANETAHLKNRDIYLMNADGSDKRLLVQMSIGSTDLLGDWSDDGRYLSITSDVSGYHRSGVYDLHTGDIRWFTPEGVTCYPGKFAPDGSHLMSYRSQDSAYVTQVYHVADGAPVAVELPPGMSYNADWLDSERFIVNITTDTRRPELRDYRLRDGASAVLLEGEYGSINPALFVGHEYVWYKSFDGLDIPALLYRPRNMEPGKKYPAIVEVHGGPTAQFMRAFDPFAQFLTDNGFIVLQPNPRGSTGYGSKFRDMALKDWGGGDLEDIAAGAAYLKGLPEVDPERLVVFGGSYGGYMTYMAMTKKPDLWKAGIAWVGISDLKRLYDSSMEHFKYYLREQMGDPDKNAALWHDRSAVHFAHQMTGKLLMIHGENDPRCPLEQAQVFRDGLVEAGKVEGKDFEYVVLSEEGHGSSDIQQKIRSYRLLVDFLQRSV